MDFEFPKQHSSEEPDKVMTCQCGDIPGKAGDWTSGLILQVSQ